MGKTTIFIRRRDGRIEVRLNDYGRTFVRDLLTHLMDVETQADHPWRSATNQPIDPASDADDPLWVLERERMTSSHAELALMTVDDEFLTDAEAWAWLCALQNVLRGVSSERGFFSDTDVERASDDALSDVRLIQLLLFELAEVVTA